MRLQSLSQFVVGTREDLLAMQQQNGPSHKAWPGRRSILANDGRAPEEQF